MNLFNKDTRDLFMYIVHVVLCASYHIHYLFIVACYLSLLLIYFVHCSILIYFLFDFCFIVHCSKEKDSILILDCIPGILILLINNCTGVQEYNHHPCKSIHIIHQTSPTLSQYRSEGPITIIDIAG